MSVFKLFIATSIDGFIARTDGSIDWLEDMPTPEGVDYGYGDFMSTIGTVLMGRKTYEDVVGFDVDWPYGDYKTYVVSTRNDAAISTPNTDLIHNIEATTLSSISANTAKDIWVVGGGELIASFLNEGLIDSMLISIIPVVLGSGRPLFNDGLETKFTLESTESFENGIVNLKYSRTE